ncbi:MAG: M23 family metallopeptidase [Caulobacter sp.]|nr:M23 family metallopeptidase [Caulobacter sp.]
MAAPAWAAEIHQAQIEARAPWTPSVAPGSDGRAHLAYELHVTSFNDGPVTLRTLSVFADRAEKPLLTLEGAALADLLAHPPEKADPQGVTIEAGRRRVFHLWLTLPEGAATPKALRHQLTFETADGGVQRADDVRVEVSGRSPVALGPPLRGGRWLAVDGPGNPHSHHWGSLVAVGGAVTIPQRYAIDWFGLDEANHSLRGPHDSLAATTDADWIGFGAEVLAVADGVVRDARGDLPDGAPLKPLATPDDLTARTLYGNFVVLEIAPGVFAHYAHLSADGMNVKIGQRVRRGEVIGRLGQTGAAGAPHLHFQVSDRPTFEQSEGLPFTIDAFTVLGVGSVESTFDVAAPVTLGAQRSGARRGRTPLDGDVVRFGEKTDDKGADDKGPAAR